VATTLGDPAERVAKTLELLSDFGRHVLHAQLRIPEDPDAWVEQVGRDVEEEASAADRAEFRAAMAEVFDEDGAEHPPPQQKRAK
jgi:pyruvate-formate lyase-activating enzyme